jgi:sialidase-1
MRQPDALAKFFRVVLLAFVFIAMFGVTGPVALFSAERPNVLLIAIDDLRPELGCYGVGQVKSPNIDAFAKTALVAGRAYCQQAVCNPSRTSLMTGQRPDSIGVVSNHVHFRDKQPNVVTLPQHFRQHGYHAQAIGKVYHGVFPDGASKTVWDTMGDPPSWSAPAIRFGPRYYYTESGVAQAKQAFLSSYRPKNPAADDWTKKLVFGPMTEAPDVPDETLYDGKVASSAVQFLNEHATSNTASSLQPFFLAVGFIKPHSPFVAPKKYWDMYDPAEIDLAANPNYPENAPTLAGHGSHEIRRYTDQPNKGAFSEENRRRLKHGYYSCISYIDAQVGRVLAALEKKKLSDNTIVVLFGDHGWHLGEHDLWGKTTNFELDTRAPLIIRHPKMKSAGSTSQSLVEFVDIYPTLAELAGIPHPARTDGKSFAALLDNFAASTKSAAFSQYPRGKLMGYSMRTDRYRYTEWIDKSTRQVATRELYDHESDPRETINVADKKEFATAVAQLSKQLAGGEGWQTASNVAVYERGDGVENQFGYRIPALSVTKHGSLLAFCERRIGLHDHAQNDVVVRRSTDSGKSWSDTTVIADEGGDSLNDPLAVVLQSGRILVRYKRYPKGVHARNSSHTVMAEPGYDGPKNVRIYLAHSDDDGKTWTKPREVTRQIRRPNAIAVGSPGTAIQLTQGPNKGRIVFPNYEVYNLGDGKRSMANSASYSDDNGETWKLSDPIDEGGVPGFGNEAQVVELAGGAVLMSSRSHTGGSFRQIAVSLDGGATWGAHRQADDLLTPACMSSIIRYRWPTKETPGVLFHSLPSTSRSRSNGAIMVSYDEGKTWHRSRVIVPGAFAYSSLSVLSNGDIGCLYEASGYRSIRFMRLSAEWLLSAPIHTSVAGQSAVQLSEELKSTATSTSFEELKSGELGEQSDASGTWKSESGHATVHVQHQRTGKQSLRLLGGEKHAIEWTPAGTKEKSATKDKAKTKEKLEQLEFWFERWTSRTPFDFRVSVFSEGNWKTLHHDTRKAVVGSFKNHLTLPLVGLKPEKFRFESTTPAKSGVMIDDLRLTVAKPMELKRFKPIQTVSPVLIRNKVNPVLGIELEAEGSQSPITAGVINIRLDGTTNLSDIEYVEAYWAGTSELPTRDMDTIAEKFQRFGEPQKPKHGLIEFKGSVTLSPGINRFWISVKLKDTASLTNHIGVVLSSTTVDRQGLKYSWVPVGGVPKKLRIGYAVRKGGDDKAKAFRIPGLCRTNKGTLIGVYDVRYRGWGDLPGDIDVGMSRSTDGGQTWEPMKVVMDTGDDPKWRYDGVGDPAVMVDRKTNTIWVAGTWSHGNRSWIGSGPGLEPAETGQFLLTKSEDDGVTWSKPINITKQIKKPEWCFVLQGPGRGITMQDGTLVFCAQYQDPPENKRLPHSTIIYSKDRGETWHIGTGAYPDTTESAVAEIEPGVLMLNCRYNRQNRRVVMVTRDMGKTWSKHPTSRKSLPEPGSCMASMVTPRSDMNNGIDDWVLFSNPNVGNSPRRRMTIKASNDRGATWPTHWHTLIDEGPSAGYSCLTMVDEKHVGILFEGNRSHMTFLKIPLSELTHVPAEFKPTADDTSLRLPQVFQDHMVLQRGKPIPVWGKAAADAAVSVSFGDKKVATKANGDGNWRVDLPAHAANSKPSKLTITSGKTIVIDDVLVGDVWIAAGQSNMEWPLAKTDDGAAAIQSADDPELRLLYLRGAARGGSGNYTDDHLRRLTVDRFCQGNWQVSSPKSAEQFSAVAYYFARRLRRETGVPVGVICPAIGGTPAEAWIRREALASSPKLAGLVTGNWMENKLLGDWCPQRAASNLATAMSSGKYIPADDLGPNHSFKPCFMWDAGVAPLVPFAISGFIWYQGESNAQLPERTAQHPEIFSTLIRDWRNQWATSAPVSSAPVSSAPVSSAPVSSAPVSSASSSATGDLPFLFVQLPALNRPYWPEFRDGQRRVAAQLENVGMAITIDTGNPSNVHPTDKTQVGERLASLAVKMKKSSSWNTSGPSVAAAKLASGKLENGKLRVTFLNCTGDLRTRDGKPPRYFEVAGEDKKFIPAEVQIHGKTVLVEAGPLADVRYVRYAWLPWPEPPVNMCDSDMFPMSPFEVKVTK